MKVTVMNKEAAIEFAYETKAMGILEKDGAYKTAKDWDEIEYAQSKGWIYIGHPAEIRKVENQIIDENRRITTPRGSFRLMDWTMEQANKNGYHSWFWHEIYVIVGNGTRAYAIKK